MELPCGLLTVRLAKSLMGVNHLEGVEVSHSGLVTSQVNGAVVLQIHK